MKHRQQAGHGHDPASDPGRAGGVSSRTGKPTDLAVNDRFFDLYDSMIGEIEIPATLRDMAGVVCNELGCERATVYLLSEETQELSSVATVGNVARVIHLPIRPDSLAGFCALTGRSFIVPDARGDLSSIDSRLRFDPTWDEMNNFRTRDVMCAPAVFKDETVGVVQAINSLHGTFDADALQALRSVSRLVGYSLYHARLHDDLATMKQLERRKAEFMRVMVHELKSPLAASRMMAVLIRQSSLDEQSQELVRRITARIDQMLDMISDILGLAQVKAGGLLGEVRVLNLSEETERIVAEYRPVADGKGLHFGVKIPPEAIEARMDAQGYRLILSNLISNAIKYTSSGRVAIALAREGPEAVISVSDTGMGIPAADVPRLFTEFFRASNARKSQINGSGVGLAGVKQIVERFRGELSLESQEGEGSTFIVRLPLHGDSPADPRPA